LIDGGGRKAPRPLSGSIPEVAERVLGPPRTRIWTRESRAPGESAAASRPGARFSDGAASALRGQYADLDAPALGRRIARRLLTGRRSHLARADGVDAAEVDAMLLRPAWRHPRWLPPHPAGCRGLASAGRCRRQDTHARLDSVDDEEPRAGGRARAVGLGTVGDLVGHPRAQHHHATVGQLGVELAVQAEENVPLAA